jgi:hypothetical protein
LSLLINILLDIVLRCSRVNSVDAFIVEGYFLPQRSWTGQMGA